MFTPVRRINVGVDGSETSLAALAWAAAYADRAGADLHLIAAEDVAARSTSASSAVRARLTVLIESERDWINVRYPALTITASAMVTAPDQALLTAATDADLTVLGAPSRAGLANVFRASVAQTVCARATGPVVVVPAGVTGLGDGPVVVGADGSRAGALAAHAAFAYAEQHGVPLTAVHVWSPIYLTPGARPLGMPDTAMLDATGPDVKATLEEPRARHPRVRVQWVVGPGRAADVLAHVAEGAGLLVVGSRGAGDLLAAFTGSVSRRLVRVSPCPVMVLNQGVRRSLLANATT